MEIVKFHQVVDDFIAEAKAQKICTLEELNHYWKFYLEESLVAVPLLQGFSYIQKNSEKTKVRSNPDFVIDKSLKEAKPMVLKEGGNYFIKKNQSVIYLVF